METSRYQSAGADLSEANRSQQAKITAEYEDRFGLRRRQVATDEPKELSFEEWINQHRDHVVNPSYSNGITTPFQEAVNNQNVQMGQATIAAARQHEVSDNELLAPLKTQYDEWLKVNPEAAHQLITTVRGMGDESLSLNFYTHTLQSRLVSIVRSVPRDTWNIDTTDNRWLINSTRDLPMQKLYEVARKAINQGIPLDELLEPFQQTHYPTQLERNDPRMMQRLQANHRKYVQRKIITHLYNKVIDDYSKAQVKYDETGKPKRKPKNPST